MDRKLFWKSYRRSARGMGPKAYAYLVGYPWHVSDTEEANRRPDKLKEVLTDHEKKVLHSGIYGTWCQIAPNMEKNARAGGFELTNLVAVESCIDADHLLLDGVLDGNEAEMIVRRLYSQFEPDAVLLYLCSIIKLR